MRYDNNERLRQYLDRGAAGAYREHMRHPGFELDATAFAVALGVVRDQHPDLSDDEAEARAAFRLLTSGVPPEVAVALPSRWYRTRAWTRRTAQRAWPWLKLAWALAVLLLAALAAHAEPPPDSGNAVARSATLHALLVRPPALLPQLAGGSVAARVQYLNGSNAWTSVSASNPLPMTCISGCSGSGGGGGGTSLVDEVAFAEGTTAFTPSGGYYKSSLTALTSGQGGSVALTANRAFHITAYSSGGTELFTSGNAAYVQFPSSPSVSISGTPSVAQGGAPWSVSQSGTWTVQPGNTANTTAWLVTGTGGTFPVTGTFWQATQPVSGTFWQATQPVSAAAGQFASGSIADGAMVTLGSKANAKSAATDTTAITVMQVLKEISAMAQAPAALPANQSTNIAQVNAHTLVEAGVNGTQAVGGNTADGSAIGTDPIPMAGKGSGVNRVPIVCDNWTPFSLASTTALKIVAKSAGKNVYICSINIGPIGTASTLALIAGTKTTNDCDTSTAGLAGGTTAATGWSFGANGGLTMGTGIGVVAGTASTGLDVCLLAGTSNQISGVISWTQF